MNLIDHHVRDPPRVGSPTSLRRRLPVVTTSMQPRNLGGRASCRTAYPTNVPTPSLHSSAMQHAMDVAAMRHGCVTTMRVSRPTPRAMASLKTYCGHCVDLPEPVPPAIITTRRDLSDSTRSRRITCIGSDSRSRFILQSLPLGSRAASSSQDRSSATRTSLQDFSLDAMSCDRRFPPLPASARGRRLTPTIE